MSKRHDSQKTEAKSQAPTGSAQQPSTQAGSSSFVGTWTSEFYNWQENKILPPGKFPLTITQESPETLDGSFPLEGHHDAKLWGHLSHGGRLWCGTFKGILEGTFVFILDDDEKSFHGAWVLDEREGPPQPWWGVKP
jgi:hypothetical protein